MVDAPRFVLFAGVNGAGKTTLYRSDMWKELGIPSYLQRVNSDEILVQQGGDWRVQKDQIAAGREAIRRAQHYLAHGESFNQETTLAGRTILRNIRRARDVGFLTTMFYVGVDSPQMECVPGQSLKGTSAFQRNIPLRQHV